MMQELNMQELQEVSGGNPLVPVLWTVLVGGHEALNELGRGIGAGIYDATH